MAQVKAVLLNEKDKLKLPYTQRAEDPDFLPFKLQFFDGSLSYWTARLHLATGYVARKRINLFFTTILYI